MSLNLHAAVRGVINAVNADIQGIILRSAGSVTLPNGKRKPEFLAAEYVTLQVQPLSAGAIRISAGAIRQTEFLGLQGVMRSVYIYGITQGVVRPFLKGGDMLQFAEYPGVPTTTWLVTDVPETWGPGWSRVIVTLQTDKTPL